VKISHGSNGARYQNMARDSVIKEGSYPSSIGINTLTSYQKTNIAEMEKKCLAGKRVGWYYRPQPKNIVG